MAKNETQKDDISCPTPLKICIVGMNKETKKAVIFNPPCRQWTCPVCQERNRLEWEFQALRGAMVLQEKGQALSMLTITSRHYATPVKSLHYFKKNWPKLVRRAKYHAEKSEGVEWAYLLIPERHKSGVLHCHAIITAELSERWWKNNAYASGFGYMAHVDSINYCQEVVKYVAKYLGKDVIHDHWPKGFRRVRTSRNWPKMKELQPPGWDYSKHSEESAWFEYYLLKDYGFEVVDKRQR